MSNEIQISRKNNREIFNIKYSHEVISGPLCFSLICLLIYLFSGDIIYITCWSIICLALLLGLFLIKSTKRVTIDYKNNRICIIKGNRLKSRGSFIHKDNIKFVHLSKTIGKNAHSIIMIRLRDNQEITIQVHVSTIRDWFSPIKEEHSEEIQKLYQSLNDFRTKI